MEIVPHQQQEISPYQREEKIKNIEAFQAKLNAEPSKVESSQGFETVPISTVENDLDEDFAGLWETENFRWQVIANEIVGAIDLKVYHPAAGVWLKKSGAASVMIQQDSGAKIDDISKKKKNALIKDFAKLEVMCIKSAAKKLGKKFGRDLNRKWIDQYEAIYTNAMESNEAIAEIAKRMESVVNMPQLLAIFSEYPDLHGNALFKKHFGERRTQLTKDRERAEGVFASCETKKELQALKNQIVGTYPDLCELIDKKMEGVKS